MGKGKSLDKLRWRAEVEVGGSGCGINNDKKYLTSGLRRCVYILILINHQFRVCSGVQY